MARRPRRLLAAGMTNLLGHDETRNGTPGRGALLGRTGASGAETPNPTDEDHGDHAEAVEILTCPAPEGYHLVGFNLTAEYEGNRLGSTNIQAVLGATCSGR